MKNLFPIFKYVFMTPWCPANRLKWYRDMILLTTRTADSFSDVIWNNRKSNRIYLSANVSTFLIAALEVGN